MVRQEKINSTDTKNFGFTLDDFAALLDKYDYHFSPGDVVVGTVFSLESRGALIDIGAKTAAYISIQEMSINRVDAPEEVLQSNETREFFILTDENEDGQLTLSLRRIEYMRAWERVRQLQAEDVTVRAQVFATNRGGALVRIEGLRGFIPGSHISTRKAKEELVNEELPLKFLEVDEDRNRLVLSHRRALVGRKMNRLEVGEVVIGSVRGIKPYGAFIDIGGVSGLLHISEISHDHIDTPHSVFNVNDEVKVMIIDLDAERGRISLSTKQLEPEPGDMIKNRERVYEMADEMAAKYRKMLLAKASGQPLESIEIPVASIPVDDLIEEEIPSAMEEAEIPYLSFRDGRYSLFSMREFFNRSQIVVDSSPINDDLKNNVDLVNVTSIDRKHINAWISEISNEVKESLIVDQAYTLNFLVGDFVENNLVNAPPISIQDIPESGLNTDWVISSSTVTIAEAFKDSIVSITATKIDSKTVWLARFPLQMFRHKESEVRQLKIVPITSDNVNLTVLVFAGATLYRQFDVNLDVICAS
jgi:small subunit ribosomal protein S1